MRNKKRLYIILTIIVMLMCGVLIYIKMTNVSYVNIGICQSRFYKDYRMPYGEIFTSEESLHSVRYLFDENAIFESLLFDEYDYVFIHHAPVKHFKLLLFGDECSSFSQGKVIVPTYDTTRTEYVYIYAIKPKGKYRLPCP